MRARCTSVKCAGRVPGQPLSPSPRPMSMEARQTLAGAATFGLLIAGCAGDSAKPTKPSDSAATAPSTSVEQPHTMSESPRVRTSEPESTAPPEDPTSPPLRVLIATLREAGVRSVGQAEPPHGSRFRVLSGQFDGRLVIATVGRRGSGLFHGLRHVTSSERSGLVVLTLRDSTGLQAGLRCHGLLWLLSIAGGSSKDELPHVQHVAAAVADAC